MLHGDRRSLFAKEWILENRANAPSFKAIRRQERGYEVEEVGRRLRKLMSSITVGHSLAAPVKPRGRRRGRSVPVKAVADRRLF